MRQNRDKPKYGHGAPTAPLDQGTDRPEARRIDQTPIDISRYKKTRQGAGNTAESRPGDAPAGAE
jgi:hypothetical protein